MLFVRAWGPPLAWAGIIFLLSSIPGTSLPQLPAANADKLVHAAVYGVLGALTWRALRLTRPHASDARTVLIVTLLATLYGMSDELHQMFTPLRTPDWRDVLSDLVGGCIGGVFGAYLAYRRKRARRPRLSA